MLAIITWFFKVSPIGIVTVWALTVDVTVLLTPALNISTYIELLIPSPVTYWFYGNIINSFGVDPKGV